MVEGRLKIEVIAQHFENFILELHKLASQFTRDLLIDYEIVCPWASSVRRCIGMGALYVNACQLVVKTAKQVVILNHRVVVYASVLVLLKFYVMDYR